MLNSLRKPLAFLRARWRWMRGCCPLCDRNLYAAFPSYMAAYPDCPVCKGETETDLRMWHTYRTLAAAKAPEVVAAKE
jgi:hypothetical protein